MDNHNSDAMELTMNLVRIDSTDPGGRIPYSTTKTPLLPCFLI